MSRATRLPAKAARTASTTLAPTGDCDAQAASWSISNGNCVTSVFSCWRKATPKSQARKPSTASTVAIDRVSDRFGPIGR